MPQISVIVPVYKVESYLHRCVDSILAQTFTDFELILVDDGSPDSCSAICDEYATKDSRVRVIHQENGGLSAARNAGIDWAFANSTSHWLTFIDSDDWIHEEYLSVLYRAAVDTGCRISMCLCTRDEKYHVMSEEIPAAEKWTPEEAFSLKHTRECYAYAWGRLYAKECFAGIRYPNGKIYEDIYTTYKLIFKEEWIAGVNCRLYYYFDNPAGIVKSKWTPKRMDDFLSREQLLTFFEKNGYTWLYENNFRMYVFVLSEQCMATRSVKDYHSYWKLIHKRLCTAMRAHREWFSIRSTPWAYEAANPRLAWCYWTWQSVKNKLPKVMGKNIGR